MKAVASLSDQVVFSILNIAVVIVVVVVVVNLEVDVSPEPLREELCPEG